MKKIIVAAMSALLALAAFTGCTYKASEFIDVAAEDKVVDLATASVGYGVTITAPEADGDPLVISGTAYSQSCIELPAMGYPKAEIVVTSTTGKTTVGFLKSGAAAWDGRIAGADAYWDDPIATEETKVLEVPADAAFITFGSNGEDSVITIKSITLKAE